MSDWLYSNVTRVCIGLCKTDCQGLVSDGKDQLQWCTVLQVYCKPDI